MKPVLEIHPVQGKILKVLLFQTEARFTELNPDKISTDQFNFHLKALLDAGLLEKLKSQKYGLTLRGKEFANRFDTEKIVLERQAKLALAITAIKIIKGKKYYLIQQRLKQPYFGYHGVVTGKIRWGEKVTEAAAREFQEETGLLALKMTVLGVYHKMDYNNLQELLEDKYFFRLRIDRFSGKFVETIEGGKNLWCTKEEIMKLPNIFPDILTAFDWYDQNKVLFIEKKYTAEGY